MSRTAVYPRTVVYQSRQERCACTGECGRYHGRAPAHDGDTWADERCTCDANVHLRWGWYCVRCANEVGAAPYDRVVEDVKWP